MLDSYGQFKVVTSLIGVLWNLMFCGMIIGKTYCVSDKPQIKRFILYLLCGFFIMAAVTLSVNTMGVSLYNNWQNVRSIDSASFFLLCSYDLCQTITLLFAYTFYAFQLYFTFENSAMNIGKTIKYIHGFIIFLIALIIIAIFIIFFLIKSNHHKIGSGLILLVFTLCVVATLHLIILLNRRLFELILSQRQIIYHAAMRRKRTKELQSQKPQKIQSTSIDIDGDYDEKIEKKEIEMNERQLLLIKVITKLSALFGVLIPDGAMIVLFGIIAFTSHSIIMYYIFWSIFTLGHMTGSLCFFLTLSLNEGYYNFLCAKCNKLCVNICSKMAKTSMRKREEYGDTSELQIECWQ